MFNCIDCYYTSNRKLNLESHTKRKHYRELKPEEKINKNTTTIKENTTIIKENTMIIKENMTILKEKTFKCEKCTKILTTKQSLNYHIKVCKGVLNPLECHYCHKVLANSSSKSQHIKTCKEKEKKELEEKQIVEGGITIINNNNYNIQLINFNMKSNEYTKFITDHITDKEIIRLIKDNKHNYNEMIESYFSKLYDNPLNICVRKLQEKAGYSEVIETGKWNKKPDSIVYPHLVKDISYDLFEKVDVLMEEDKIKGKICEEIHEYLNEIMIHEIDKEDIDILKNSKDAMKRIKCFILNNNEI